MSGAVWLNGSFVDRDSARVSAFDAGFQHGVGLFETLLSVRGSVFKAREHIRRLARSARELNLSESLDENALLDAVRQTAERAGLERARVRLTVTGGDLNLLASTGRAPTEPTILIVAQPATEYPREMFDNGVLATVADSRANPLDPFASHKTLNYWPRLRALQTAAGKGAGEAIFLQVTNHLAGGAVSNLFIAREGALATPIARGEEEKGALPSPVRPGVTRETVMNLAVEAGVSVHPRMLSIEDLVDADEAFLTNSSWGALPITRVEDKTIGPGKPGPITEELRSKWLAAIESA